MCCVSVAELLGELDAVIGQDRVDAIGDSLEQMFEELPPGLAIRLFYELCNGKFAGPINTYKEIELALRRLNLCDVPSRGLLANRCRAADMEETNGVSLESLPLWFVALDIRQARDAMPLKAPM